ncbi:ABC transporter ATP-binding protein [Ensifer adhaerens]|uniref:ABC transporter ATP-binding protein n=1 Tax=Ensifer adhaerens TaxID=106592 RepID=UPI003CF94F29
MASIDIANIQKSYGIHPVLHDVDLKIGDGEFVVLVGPSGCGKSTLLRMIAGLEDISAGEITIGGKVVNDMPAKERDIAMVFQSYALYPHMKVAENMSFALKLAGAPKAEIEKRVTQAAEILGLEKLLDRLPRELSGGQRQRVAMGRAIVRDPRAFLFDEPLSNLDAKLRVKMRSEIKKLHQRLRRTMVYVTHDQTEAMTMADKIVVMNGGKIEQAGAPLDLYNDPANLFVAGFIGSPGMNFFEGTYRNGTAPRFETEGGIIVPAQPHPALTDGARATLGIRPEHVEIGVEGPDALNANVDLVEPTGFGIILHLSFGRAGFKAFTNDRRFLNVSGSLPVRLPVERLHFFNADGNRV